MKINGYEIGPGANLRRANLRDANLHEANLHEANLRGADLRRANLRDANLLGADLRDTNLRRADLRWADLRGADLIGADLSDANLRDANLSGAHLRWANLGGANLSGADLRWANLGGANLRDAKNIPEIAASILFVPPKKGSFTAFKKLKGNKIAELFVPARAKRSSATTRKCRASEAKVVRIFSKLENGFTQYHKDGLSDLGGYYKAGEYVKPDKWDDNRWNECSHGIHFFMTEEEAWDW